MGCKGESSKRPRVRFGRGREQNTFPGAGAGNYRQDNHILAGNGEKPIPGAGNSRHRESRSFPRGETCVMRNEGKGMSGCWDWDRDGNKRREMGS